MNTSVAHQLIKRGHVFKSPENLKLYCKMRSQTLVNIVFFPFAARPEGGIIQDLKQQEGFSSHHFVEDNKPVEVTGEEWPENPPKSSSQMSNFLIVSHSQLLRGKCCRVSNKRKLEKAKGEKKKNLILFSLKHPIPRCFSSCK